MELERIKNLENVRRHREDICSALGIEFKEDMLTSDSFIGRFNWEFINFLDSQGLINRGFCPVCGVSPIGSEYFRKVKFSKAVEYLCQECYNRTNPYLSDPGYATRKRFYWVLYIGFLIGLFFLIRGCIRAIF